jgi:anti-sigma-K factor RskA
VDIQQYIQSGVIESYVLGTASDEEVAEVETLRKQYSEVQNAIEEFSIALEQEALANAIPPPAGVKEKIFKSLNIQYKDEQASPVIPLATETPSEKLAPVRTLNWKMAAAASIILLAGSIASNVYLYNRYSNTSSKYQALLVERESLQANNNIYQTKLREWRSAAEMMADPEMMAVKMPAATGKSNVMATVFWHTRTKDVYVLPNKLPAPAENQQYQLWALIDGKPVDAGMIDPTCVGACKMKNVPRAQAFAITLEQKGGSAVPTMTQLFVLGNV